MVSKLISKMMGGNIAELMNTLQSAGLSEQAQEREQAAADRPTPTRRGVHLKVDRAVGA